MEQKNTITISVTTLLLVVAIIVICIMGYFIYNLSTEKQIAISKTEELNSEISTLENTVDTLQTTIDNVANTVNSTKTESSNLNYSKTDCQTKLEKYLNLRGVSDGSPVGLLVELDLMTYDSFDTSKTVKISGNTYVKTTVKYEDFKSEMLKYLTENYFEKEFLGYKDSDGYVAIINGGGTGISYLISDITETSITTNSVVFSATGIRTEVDSKTDFTASVSFKNVNGNYVISNIDY